MSAVEKLLSLYLLYALGLTIASLFGYAIVALTRRGRAAPPAAAPTGSTPVAVVPTSETISPADDLRDLRAGHKALQQHLKDLKATIDARGTPATKEEAAALKRYRTLMGRFRDRINTLEAEATGKPAE